jgi:uncharacterized protein (TIGR00369 family)
MLGWQRLDAKPDLGWVRIGFEGKPEFCNPAGVIQGGILAAMLDDTMGPAVFVRTDGRLYTATISMNVSYLGPASTGPIIGEASVTQLGKSVAFVEGRLTDESGRIIALATSNARLIESHRAIGRLPGAAPGADIGPRADPS